MRAVNYFAACVFTMCIASGLVYADDPFQAGKDFGSSTKSSTADGVNDAQARAVFPGYTDNSPESGYLSRATAPFQQGDDKKARCATQTEFASDFDRQDCEAVKYLSQMGGTNPFTIDKQNDPLITTFKSTMQNKPDFNSLSSNQCVTKTVELSPAQYSTEVCNQYHTANQIDCNKNLMVTASQTTTISQCSGQQVFLSNNGPHTALNATISCTGTPGSYSVAFWKSGECGSQTTYGGLGRLYTPASCGLAAILDSSLSCSGDVCTWYVNFSYNQAGAGSYSALFNRTVTNTTATINQSWDNQCASFEARSQ